MMVKSIGVSIGIAILVISITGIYNEIRTAYPDIAVIVFGILTAFAGIVVAILSFGYL